MVRVLLPLVEGFEEIEAIATIDILRRADIETVVAAVASEAGSLVRGSHGICVQPDVHLSEMGANLSDEFDAIALPGGPGVKTLLQHPEIVELTRAFHERRKTVAAICAAPLVLSEAGILRDRVATSFPSVRDRTNAASYSSDRVVADGHILTSRGAGTAVEFALQLVAMLVGEEKAKAVGHAIVSDWSPLPLPVS